MPNANNFVQDLNSGRRVNSLRYVLKYSKMKMKTISKCLISWENNEILLFGWSLIRHLKFKNCHRWKYKLIRIAILQFTTEITLTC